MESLPGIKILIVALQSLLTQSSTAIGTVMELLAKMFN